MKSNKFGILKEDLQQKYCKECKSVQQIATDYGCTSSIIVYYINKFGIIRSEKDEKKSQTNTSKYKLTREFLYTEFVTKNKCKRDIAKKVGCGEDLIRYYIKKFNIQKSEKLQQVCRQRAKKRSIKTIQSHKTIPEEVMKDLWYNQFLTKKEICKKFNYDICVINRLIKKYKLRNTKKRKDFLFQKQCEIRENKTGYKFTFANPKVIEKSKQTCLEKYNVSNYGKTQARKDYYEKISNVIKNKRKQTCLIKYGFEYAFQSKKVYQKCLDTKRKIILLTLLQLRRLFLMN